MRNPESRIGRPFIRGLVRLLGFRISRFVLYHTLIRAMLPRHLLSRLCTTVAAYFSLYLVDKAPEDSPKIAKRFIRHYRLKLCEDIVLLNLGRRHIHRVMARNVVVENIDNFNRAFDMQNGILAVGAHVGSVILGTVALVDLAKGVTGSRRRSIRICTDPQIMPFFPPRTAGDTYAFISNSLNRRDMISQMVASLRTGAMVTSNLDVLSGGSSNRAFRLFDKANVLLPAVVGSAKIARLASAVILPWTNRRDGHGKLVLEFEEPIVPSADPDLLSEELCRLLEKWILRSPEQWLYWDRFEKRLLNNEPV